MLANFKMIPRGIERPKGKAETVRPASTQGMLISAQSEHPEAVVKVMELLCSSPDAFATSQKGPEGVNWEWTDKDGGMIGLMPRCLLLTARNFRFKT